MSRSTWNLYEITELDIPKTASKKYYLKLEYTFNVCDWCDRRICAKREVLIN